MLSLTFFSRTFTFSWQKFLFALLGVLFFIGLGVWQLERAHEKRQMLLKAQTASVELLQVWHEKDKPQPYQRLEITGTYLPTMLWLDNQSRDHIFGYDLLLAIETTDHQVLIVDQGFVRGDATRQSLPKITIPRGTQTVIGYAYYPSFKHWLLGVPYEIRENHQVLVEVLDSSLFSKILHKTVYPFIIRSQSGVPDGLNQDWPLVSMPPERHMGYAIQWFALALLVMGIWVACSLKKNT